jgi:large subunit ribosomal protein L3
MATTAIVGEKVGMSQKWVDDRIVPVTVLRVEPMRIVQVKTPERDGYSALQVTYGSKDAKKLNKPEAGHFAKSSVDPGKRLVELRLDSVDGYEVGQEIAVSVVEAGAKVDVTAVSRGKGFAGTMKLAPSAPAPSRVVCSRACVCPATWATSRSRPSTSRSSSPIRSATCCSSRVRSPAPTVASSSSATP